METKGTTGGRELYCWATAMPNFAKPTSAAKILAARKADREDAALAAYQSQTHSDGVAEALSDAREAQEADTVTVEPKSSEPAWLDDNMVEPDFGCPVCKERRADQLELVDDEKVICRTCGKSYNPETGEVYNG
jgi:nitrite reductase/ring-hydroxylating ferredoxin subunit